MSNNNPIINPNNLNKNKLNPILNSKQIKSNTTQIKSNTTPIKSNQSVQSNQIKSNTNQSNKLNSNPINLKKNQSNPNTTPNPNTTQIKSNPNTTPNPNTTQIKSNTIPINSNSNNNESKQINLNKNQSNSKSTLINSNNNSNLTLNNNPNSNPNNSNITPNNSFKSNKNLKQNQLINNSKLPIKNNNTPKLLTLFFNEGDESFQNKIPKLNDSVIKLICERNADLLFIGTQETSFTGLKTTFINEIEILLKDKYTVVYKKNGTSDFGGIIKYKTIKSALFIRNDINKEKIKYFKKFNIGKECSLTKTKDATLFLFEYCNVKYCILNTHLSFNDKPETKELRKKQFLCLVEKIVNYFDKYIILFGGDLNFRILDESNKELNKELKESNQNITTLNKESTSLKENKPNSSTSFKNKFFSLFSSSSKNKSNSSISTKKTNSINSLNSLKSNNEIKISNKKNELNILFNLLNESKNENILKREFQIIKNGIIEKKIALLKEFKKNLEGLYYLTCKYKSGSENFILEKNNTKKFTLFSSKNKTKKKRIPSRCDKILFSIPENVKEKVKVEINVIPRKDLLISDHILIYATVLNN